MKHSHHLGQFVYTAAIRLANGVYGVELRLDVPKSGPEGTLFKGQTLKTKIADAVLSVRPRSFEPLRTSTDEASAKETVRLGEIVSTPQIIPQGGVTMQKGKSRTRSPSSGQLRRGVAKGCLVCVSHSGSVWGLYDACVELWNVLYFG